MRRLALIFLGTVACGAPHAPRTPPTPSSTAASTTAVVASPSPSPRRVAPEPVAPSPSEDPFAFMKGEELGGIRYGMTQVEVQVHMGLPKKRSRRVEEGATGDWVETWTMDASLSIGMRADTSDGPLTVRSVLDRSASVHASGRNVHVGAPRSLVLERYAAEIDAAESTPRTIVAGSRYGGLVFFMQGDVVKEMVLGAVAE